MGRRRGRIRVKKASGRTEPFDERKFRRSLLRSGVDPGSLDALVDRVMEQVGPEAATSQIYRLAHREIARSSRPCGMRYSLKKALFLLGPTGYPFERYVGHLYREYGFKTDVGLTLKGRCITHEVDVLAVGESEVAAMECKYHNRKGTVSDVKTAMYVHARMRDLGEVLSARHGGKGFVGRLVTNTRCTSEALEFAECAGLKVLSWNYPRNKGLEDMITEKKLYPVTVVSGVQAGLVDTLVRERILLLRDLLTFDVAGLQRRLSLSPSRARTLLQRAEALCG